MNRYSNKRHRGPTHRGFKIKEAGFEGSIPVLVGIKPTQGFDKEGMPYMDHIRGFLCHPTKGWRSTGPEGRR